MKLAMNPLDPMPSSAPAAQSSAPCQQTQCERCHQKMAKELPEVEWVAQGLATV
jgi:hypothetical protein